MLSVIELDTSLARTHLGLQAKEDPLEKTVLYTIVSRLISDTDANLKMQYTEMLKVLLDPGSGPLPGTAMATEVHKMDICGVMKLTMIPDGPETGSRG